MILNLRRLAYILAIILLLATIVFWGATSLLEKKIETLVVQRLNEVSGSATTLSSVAVNPLFGRVELYGLGMGQPPGFGEGRMLYVPRLMVDLGIQSVFADGIGFDAISVEEAELDLRMDTNGVSNVGSIMSKARSKEADPPTAEPDTETGRYAVDELVFTNCEVAVEFLASDGGTNRVEIAVSEIRGENLHFGPSYTAARSAPGHIQAKGQIQQTPLPSAKFGVVADVAGIGGGDPFLVLALRMTGFELAPLAPVLPKGTGAVIGGNAIDFSADICGDRSDLNGEIKISTIAGYDHVASITGTLYKPEISAADKALVWLIGRSSGMVGNTLQNLSSAGMQTMASAGKVVGGVAEGAAKTVESFGSGLWNTAKGLVTLDPKEMGKGVKEMGVSVVGGAKGAVFTATGDVMEGVSDITSTAMGGKVAAEWRRNASARWTNVWQAAKTNVDQRSFCVSSDNPTEASAAEPPDGMR